MAGKSTGTERDLQGIERKHSGWSVEGRKKKKKKKLCMWSMAKTGTPQPESCVSCCRWGLAAGKWDLEHRTRVETAVGSKKTTGRDRSKEFHNQ